MVTIFIKCVCYIFESTVERTTWVFLHFFIVINNTQQNLLS